MMCFKYRKLIIPYSEGALDERARAKMEAHLAVCEGCRRELEAVQSVSKVLLSMDEPAAEPASDLWARVSAQIARESPAPAPRPWLRVTQAASAVAAVALVAVVAFGVFHRVPETATRQERTQVAAVPDQRNAAAPEVKKPKPGAVYYEGPAKRAPESTAEPRPAPVPAKTQVTDSGSAERVKRYTNTPAQPPRREKAEEKPVEMASVDLPEHHSFSFKSRYSLKSKSMDVKGTMSRSVELDKTGEVMGFSRNDDMFYADAAPGAPHETNDNISMDMSAKAAASAPSAVSESELWDGFHKENHDFTLGGARSMACAAAPAGVIVEEETAVDVLNRTEGVHIAAMFQYP